MHTPEYVVERDQDAFESLLARWSKRSVTVPAEQVDRMIDQCQRSICESFGLDRSELWQACDETNDCLVLTHLHQRTEGAREVFSEATWVSNGDRLSERREI